MGYGERSNVAQGVRFASYIYGVYGVVYLNDLTFETLSPDAKAASGVEDRRLGDAAFRFASPTQNQGLRCFAHPQRYTPNLVPVGTTNTLSLVAGKGGFHKNSYSIDV